MKVLKIAGITILIILAILVGLYLYIKYKASNIEDKKDLELSIDKKANKHIEEGNAYGLVIGVVKNGKVLLKGYGTTQKGKNILPDSTTVFELASTSKLFTTATLQLLVEEGQLNLDDKIQTLIGDSIQLPAIAQKTTLRHLATHLAGFPSIPEAFIAKMTDENNPYKSLKTQDIYDYLKTCKEKQPDGTFEYSNFGMGLLGHLLQVKSGIKYEQLVTQKLLEPLDMKNTFVTINDQNKKNVTQGYDPGGDPTPVWEDDVLTGAGSFLSNGSDMIKFIKANLNANQTSLSKALIKTHQQQLNGDSGLGWVLPSAVVKLVGNKDIVWHNGMAGGYASYIAIDKKNNYGIIILSNKGEDVTKLGMILTRIVRTQSWSE